MVLGNQQHHEVLRRVHLTRYADEKMAKLAKQNKGGTFHLASLGHELVGVIGGLALDPKRDWSFPYYRDRPFVVGLGASIEELFAAFLAKGIAHHSGGKMMPEHFCQPNLRIPCQSSVVASQFLQAAGVAKALSLQNKQGDSPVVYVSAGDGATSQGDFHETLNFAALHCLPLIVVIQDNGWAISVPKEEQTAGGSIAQMASGYQGLEIFDVDGCDYLAVTQAFDRAVSRGRAHQGPSLIVAHVPRIGPHSSSDDPKKYKTEEDRQKDIARDPVVSFEKWLLQENITTIDEIERCKQQAFEDIEALAERAEQMPEPDPHTAAEPLFVAVEPIDYHIQEPIETEHGIVMVDALNQALKEEMERDPGVIVFGQDVAHGKGGVFGVTRELTQAFGNDRCFNTPLAESTIIGLAIGMSLVSPFKPVAEIQFADYMWTGVNQLFNELASYHYRSNGMWHCPVVIRMPCGGYIQGGPYHSQSIEAFLSHCPGLKVVIPSNSEDAKRLLKAAIRDPNPVIFLEHKGLYRQRVFSARTNRAEDELLPIGKGTIVSSGTHVTFVGWGMTVLMGFEAAQRLHKEGIFVEVIDLRSIVPLDEELIVQSLQKTGKLLIAHEATSHCGVSAEIAARIVERHFSLLDAPIVRVTGKHCPVPYNKKLENAVLPQTQDIEDALRTLAHF